MGYDVHITRALEWVNAESNPIALEEWLAYIESDPEMRLDGFAEVQTPAGEILKCESAGLAVWTAWPGVGQRNGCAWFDYHAGCIVVKNPDDEILAKMCAIAERLEANVQGDEGEYY